MGQIFKKGLIMSSPSEDFLEGTSLDDRLWYTAMRTCRRNQVSARELTRPLRDTDRPLLDLITLGVFDNSTDKSMDASVRAMRHASGMVDRLWELLEVERERVLLSSLSTCLMQTNGKLQADRLEAEATIFRREFVKMGEGFVEDMKKFHNTAVNRGSYVDRELSKAWDRMNRHRNDLEVTREALGSLDRWCRDLEEEKAELLARVSGMEAKLCRCHPTSPTLMGRSEE